MAVMMVSMSFGQAAYHLDKQETRRILRHIEERNDELEDRVDTWMVERRAERDPRVEELERATDHLEDELTAFKDGLRSHDEPWDLRNEAQELLNASADVGRAVEHGEFHRDLAEEWEQIRERSNELARHYQLPEIVSVDRIDRIDRPGFDRH